jgi:hypothetical protein
MPEESETQFVLDDFAVESAELTDAHKKRLRKLAFYVSHTIFLSKSEYWLFHMVGSASQSGSDEYNEKLSKRRAESVQRFLDSLMPGVPRKFRIFALGETSPENRKIFENSRDRAVGIVAQLAGRIPPKPVPIDIGKIIIPRAPERKEFKFQVVSYLIQTIGIGLPKIIDGLPEIPIDVHIGRIAMNFIVDDGKTKAKYTFMGEGGGSGVSTFVVGGARSVAQGTPQKFKAYARHPGDAFEGKGSLSQLFDKFLFGGRERAPSASEGWRDYPMGTVAKFEFPRSIPNLPGKEEFRGTVTKGFKPLVPEYPKPLPPSGIF